jgi:hypothetical protein
LGSGLREIRLLQQAREQRAIGCAGGGDAARPDRTAMPHARGTRHPAARSPDPCRSPRTARRGVQQREIAMPPRLQHGASLVGCASHAAWNAGASGAPSPPAATSRRRKSRTVVIRVRSAIGVGSPHCSVNAGRARGRCRSVWPWLPIAATDSGPTAAASISAGGRREGLADLDIERAGLIQRDAGVGVLPVPQDLLSERGRIGRGRAQTSPAAVRSAPGGVDGVGAGAGDQSE